MKSIERGVAGGRMAGRCDDRFGAVAAEFERNFRDRDELGASVCVRLDGEIVVDLWGDIAGQADQSPWNYRSLGFSGNASGAWRR